MSPTSSRKRGHGSAIRHSPSWLGALPLVFLVALAVPLSVSAQSHPDDIYWDPRFDELGTNGRVFAISIDGGDVYVGGHFTRVGSLAVNGIARWDGTEWHALGSGIGGVSTILVHNDTVYVSGASQAYWDGATWHGMRGGVRDSPFSPAVTDIAAFKGSIYFAGGFTTAGGKLVNGIARWDGSDWHDLAGGLGIENVTWGGAWGLESDGEYLWVGGEFNSVAGMESEDFAKWDGAQWQPLDIQFRGTMRSMALVGGDLYVGGWFTLLASSGVVGNNIMKWDGTQWHGLHGGTDEMVWTVFGVGSNVYISGLFDHAGGIPVHHVARWDGSSWHSLGSGLDRPDWRPGAVIWELAVAANDSGEVYVGGDHSSAGGIGSLHIGRWFSPVPAPSNGSPAHRSIEQPVAGRLSWQTSGRPGAGLLYDVYFGTIPNPPLFLSAHPDTSIDPDSLEFDTRYFWRIVAKDGNGDRAHGPQWTFRTEGFTKSRLVVSSVLNRCGLSPSDTITIDINVQDSAVPIDAAGVDVTYDPTLLTFLSCQPGDLTAGWQKFDCADLGTSIRVGGFDLTPIPIESSGVFARLTFLSNCCIQDSSRTVALCPVNLTDGLAPLRPVCGEFQCEVSNTQGDANGDGNVSSGDALCTFEAYLDLFGQLSAGCTSEGWEVRTDVDCNGAITPADALCIFLNWLSGSCEFCTSSPAAESARAGVPAVTVPEILFEGVEVVVPVQVSGVAAFDAFGFDVVYPKDQIEYLGLQWRAVSGDFDQIGGRRVEEDRLRLGGFAAQPADATQADLVELRFRMLAESVDGSIVIDGFVDDLEGAPAVNAVVRKEGGTPVFTRYTLQQNHPNPFNPTTTIRYEIPSSVTSVHVTLTIHDVKGRLVRKLVNETKPGGPHEIGWDGRNQDGRSVSSGVYFYVLRAGGQRFSKKLVVLR